MLESKNRANSLLEPLSIAEITVSMEFKESISLVGDWKSMKIETIKLNTEVIAHARQILSQKRNHALGF